MTVAIRPCLAALAGLLLAACAPADGETRAAGPLPPDRPYVLVLGTAQDAGLPQIGCDGEACRRAREHPEQRRFVSSILLADPRAGSRWLFDATPDLPAQLELARGHPPTRALAGPRPALFDGIFLTHAHMGHYTGLLQLGPEAYAAKGMPTFVGERMRSFLETNLPWRFLAEAGQLSLRGLDLRQSLVLGDSLSVEARTVPHRDEHSETLAFVIRGPERSLLYLPDIDKWERMRTPIESLIAEVDVALVDGTFFADGEIPGRSMDDIPHPFIAESLERFAALPAAERGKIVFTHLNHTNPAADPESEAAKRLREAGMSVACEGQIYPL